MRRISFLILVQILTLAAQGQESVKNSNVEVSGYLSEMPSVIWNSDSSQWQGLIHNRINIHWYPSSSITGSLQIRNQLFDGDIVQQMNPENGFKKENYALPLTYQQKLGGSYFLSMAIDRAWLQYTHNKLEVKLGRQRINWGQTFVWNPNDIFNTYNFFDFDYPERPGADAVRITYYPNYSSSIDLAAKMDSSGKLIGGGLFRFTKWNTEFQFLGGYYSKEHETVISDTLDPIQWEDEDLVAGFGFSSGIENVSIRGEMSYFYSLLEDTEKLSQFMASLTVDYTTANNLGMMFEVLYLSKVNLSIESMLGSSGISQDIKSLAFTKYNLFGQVSYPLTPLLSGSLSGMAFYDEDIFGFYTGPSLEMSLSDNLNLALFTQIFAFRYQHPLTLEDEWANVNYAFLRLKWNF